MRGYELNKNAQALGRLGKGKAKRFTPEVIDSLKKRLAEAREKRWPKNRVGVGCEDKDLLPLRRIPQH